MTNHNTPMKRPLMVALVSSVVILLSSVTTHAAITPGVERIDNRAASAAHYLRSQAAVNRARAISNRVTVKPVPRPNPQALHAASLRGDLGTVQRLVKDRVNIHFANSDGETALHMAASRGHLSVVIFLVNNGAHMNVRTRGNWIPLHHAVRFNRQRVANYLMAKGAPANYRTSDGVDCLDIAQAMGNKRMISLVKHHMRR